MFFMNIIQPSKFSLYKRTITFWQFSGALELFIPELFNRRAHSLIFNKKWIQRRSWEHGT